MPEDIGRYAHAPGFIRTNEPLLWFAGAGHEVRHSRSYYFNAGQRPDPPHVVLQITLAGTGFYQREGGPRELLTAGKAFVDHIPGPFEYGFADVPASPPASSPPSPAPSPATASSAASAAPGPYELVFATFAGPVAEEWMRQLHTQFGPVLDFGSDRAVTETLLALINTPHSGPASLPPPLLRDRYQLSSHLYGLLMQVFSTLTSSRVARAPLVAKAVDLIQSHAADHRFNVLTLSSRLDCSREHLAREFKRTTGISPLDYLTQQRVRLAAGALRKEGQKLETVAKQAGFSSAGYLCRVFRQTVGVTPAQFRARPWMVAP